ncbi:MAG: hypothetical protein V4628_11645 [Pseudomonadota bacterium]
MAFNWKVVPEKFEECLETKKQERVFQLLRAGSKWSAIAKELDISERNVASMAARVKARVIAAGYDQETGLERMTSQPFFVKGRSELVKIAEDGSETVAMYWNKTDTAKAAVEIKFREFVKSLCEEIKPAKPLPIPKNASYNSELLSTIYIGDAHIGMYSWGKETKHSDFDSDIASRDLRAAIDNLVDRSPKAETGILVDVGDFMHANTSHNTTWSGTPLDVDTRHSRVLRIAGKTMRYGIAKMLTKFKEVKVVIVKGNHNADAAVAVQEIVSAYFHDEPRVTVLETNGFFHYIEWGNWLFGFNHGDKVKPEKLVHVMARDQSAAWGRTTHRMWALGHFHHQDVKELDGCIVQKFAALPPSDSWHASHGFSSIQAMQMIVFKKSGGKESTLIYELPRPVLEPDLRIA